MAELKLTLQATDKRGRVAKYKPTLLNGFCYLSKRLVGGMFPHHLTLVADGLSEDLDYKARAAAIRERKRQIRKAAVAARARVRAALKAAVADPVVAAKLKELQAEHRKKVVAAKMETAERLLKEKKV